MGAIKHEAAAGRRRSAFGVGGLIAALIAVAAFLVVSAAIAVHNTGDFELEGDIVDGAAAGPDWGSVFDAGGNVADIDGGIAAGFLMDDISPAGLVDHTVFTAGGTKNNQQPTEWNWGSQSVPAKDDLSNVYAFGTVNDENELVIYSGLERLTPNGDSHIDIEFNRNLISLDEAPPCDNEPCQFLGAKVAGDVLVAMDFTKGGDFGTLRVFVWDGSTYVIAANGTISGEGCNPVNGIPADTICGFNNDGPADDGGPWPNYDNHADEIATLPQNAFTEFGINLTQLLGFTPCITSFQAHTRTSQGNPEDLSTAELKDFAAPEPLPLCGLIWEKQDGEGAPLAGATFSVCRTHDGSGNEITPECVSITDNQPPDADPADGQFDYAITVAGTYEICETAAPPGYLLDPNCQSQVVTGAGVFILEAPFVNTTPTPPPTPEPTPPPTPEPTPPPTPEPTPPPTPEPTPPPTPEPTPPPTPEPTPPPTPEPTPPPTPEPTPPPTPEPTPPPTPEPTPPPTPEPTPPPTPEPTPPPTPEPTPPPTPEPTPPPTPEPTPPPTPEPTPPPTPEPTPPPTPEPTPPPTPEPTPPPTPTPTPTATPSPTVAPATPTPTPTPIAAAVVLPPTGDGPLGGGPSLLLLLLLGGSAFAAGVFSIAVAARKREGDEVRIDE